MAAKSELARGGQRVRGGRARCRGPTSAAGGQPGFSGRSCGPTTGARATVGERIESPWGPPRHRRERRRKAGCPPAKRSLQASGRRPGGDLGTPARPQAAQPRQGGRRPTQGRRRGAARSAATQPRCRPKDESACLLQRRCDRQANIQATTQDRAIREGRLAPQPEYDHDANEL